jgi:galactose mutarotase-like enzyme
MNFRYKPMHPPRATSRVLVVEAVVGIQTLAFTTNDAGMITGKGGQVYPYRGAIAMEPQHFPDLPNHNNSPTAILHPGETHHNTIVYRFNTQ